MDPASPRPISDSLSRRTPFSSSADENRKTLETDKRRCDRRHRLDRRSAATAATVHSPPTATPPFAATDSLLRLSRFHLPEEQTLSSSPSRRPLAFLPLSLSRHLLLLFLLALLGTELALPGAEACGPGRGRAGKRRRRKHTPLVYRQHVPNVAENTLGASGLPEGKIERGDRKFKELVENRNPDIVFRDEEKSGADRIMTSRCKDKLNSLAISVMNQWPGIKLRVTEAWDEEGSHSKDSLHYEGRAVDITTSDRSRAKYGMLARLAVEAGFDWVYYENRAHIHCSVKSDSSAAIKSGGCFAGDNSVLLDTGVRKPMSSLSVGDRVAALDADGRPTFSPVLAFLDRRPSGRKFFYKLGTSDGASLDLTPSHLIYASPDNRTLSAADFRQMAPIFARDVKVGDYLYLSKDDVVRPTRVVTVTATHKDGAFAPMTSTGSIVVNGFAASCYAIFDNHWVTHLAMTPLRFYYRLLEAARGPEAADASEQDGLHWYSTLLYNFADIFVPKDLYESWFYSV